MPTATLPVPLVRVYCLNPACPERVRTGKRQVIGEATANAVVRLRCPKCRQYQTVRVGD